MTNNEDLHFIKLAIELGQRGADLNEGGPFGALVVKQGVVIGKGNNKVVSLTDPTAHAEIVAIRDACHYLGSYQLDGCTVYTSCEPCPMCLGAIYWSRPDRIVYACTREDAASINFDDHFIYQEIMLQPDQRKIPAYQFGRDEGLKLFQHWRDKDDKVNY